MFYKLNILIILNIYYYIIILNIYLFFIQVANFHSEFSKCCQIKASIIKFSKREQPLQIEKKIIMKFNEYIMQKI